MPLGIESQTKVAMKKLPLFQQGEPHVPHFKKYNVSPGQITRLKRNESVSTHTIDMFCRILECDVGDIMKYVPDEETQA